MIQQFIIVILTKKDDLWYATIYSTTTTTTLLTKHIPIRSVDIVGLDINGLCHNMKITFNIDSSRTYSYAVPSSLLPNIVVAVDVVDAEVHVALWEIWRACSISVIACWVAAKSRAVALLPSCIRAT